MLSNEALLFLGVPQAGAGLSAARHVVGALAPGAWYEVAVEAWSDAGVERVTLLADTHTLAGGKDSNNKITTS